MKIVAISDTHTKHKLLDIPECDILIHAGDFTWKGAFFEVRDFRRWLLDQPAKHKIVIAGNHEEMLDNNHEKYRKPNRDLVSECNDLIYLENAGYMIDGLKFYGTPWTPWFHDWGFNGLEGSDAPFERGLMLHEIYGWIPTDVNVLICHGPPYDLVDMSRGGDRCGSIEMRKLLENNQFPKLQLYLCGHIHEARGHVVNNGVHICNVSTLDRDYRVARPPVVIELNEDGSVISIEGY